MPSGAFLPLTSTLPSQSVITHNHN